MSRYVHWYAIVHGCLLKFNTLTNRKGKHPHKTLNVNNIKSKPKSITFFYGLLVAITHQYAVAETMSIKTV